MAEVSTGLLVALMYVTILSMGIGSVLTALAVIICVTLLLTSRYRFHVIAAAAAWVVYLVAVALRGLSVIV